MNPTIPIPHSVLRFDFRYTLQSMPVGNETVVTYIVEMSDETRSLVARGSSGVSFQDAEHALLNSGAARIALAALRERHS